MSKKFLHILSIFLTLINVLLIGAVVIGASILTMMERMTLPIAAAAACAIVLLILLDRPLSRLRQTSRMDEKYDKYGRLKQNASYKKMSREEQKKLDEIRMIEMEKILPSTLVKEMTSRGSEEPEKEMGSLTGLENVKEKMEEMAARMEFEYTHKRRTLDTAQHMVFFGPPGTGKTTCARIMTGFLYRYGYIDENFLIEVSGSFLGDENAPEKMAAVIERAYGGVLFIDEAYAILNGPRSAETIAALIKLMEDAKGYFVVILAGYTNEMKRLLRANPGFSSRIKEYFYFEDYTPEQLLAIFQEMAKEEGYRLTRQAKQKFVNLIDEAKDERNFGNARTCRNILDKSIGRHILNLKHGESFGDYVLGASDIVYEENPLM